MSSPPPPPAPQHPHQMLCDSGQTGFPVSDEIFSLSLVALHVGVCLHIHVHT